MSTWALMQFWNEKLTNGDLCGICPIDQIKEAAEKVGCHPTCIK